MKKKSIMLIMILMIISINVNSTNLKMRRVINLQGRWKIMTGDNLKYAQPGYDDTDWEKIYVPGEWEDQGYWNYNGFAWYRTKFEISEKYHSSCLYLALGYIDDVDEVFINGQLIGFSGSFPPCYSTAYNSGRLYPIPAGILNYDETNVISVRVFDSHGEGGIVDGRVGIYEYPVKFPLILNLHGLWKFNIGDELDWKDTDFDDSGWWDVVVPGEWEKQGFKDYDGFAWYRKRFVLPHQLSGENLVLIMGKIDDFDEVYLNGKRLGNYHNKSFEPYTIDSRYDYNDIRTYYLTEDKLRKGKNVIAVRVFDKGWRGGIYHGPVGFSKQKDFVGYWRRR